MATTTPDFQASISGIQNTFLISSIECEGLTLSQWSESSGVHRADSISGTVCIYWIATGIGSPIHQTEVSTTLGINFSRAVQSFDLRNYPVSKDSPLLEELDIGTTQVFESGRVDNLTVGETYTIVDGNTFFL